MIVYRGGGILAVVFPVLAAVGIWYLTGQGNLELCALATLASAVPVWFVGFYLNRSGPRKEIDKAMEARSAQLHAQVEAGQYSRGPAYPPPTTMAEAHQQAEEQLAEERQEMKNDRPLTGHMLMFIPLQYWAFPIAAVAIIYYLQLKGIIGTIFNF